VSFEVNTVVAAFGLNVVIVVLFGLNVVVVFGLNVVAVFGLNVVAVFGLNVVVVVDVFNTITTTITTTRDIQPAIPYKIIGFMI
jgi:hypothetical protein